MSKTHAKLSPSAAYRWINCPGSVTLSEQCPPAPSSAYADEGTLAHAVAETKLMLQSGKITKRQYTKDLKGLLKTDDGLYWTGEMDEATDFYTDRVMETLAAAGKDAVLLIEQRLDLDFWAEGSFGTSDAVVIGDGVLEVTDFKYGKGVKVDAPGNPQLRLYGLGAATLYEGLYEFDRVRMTIVQPRLDHVSTEELPLEELMDWGYMVREKAAEAAAGSEERACGDWCRWCPAKAICRTRAEKQLDLARYDFRKPALLTNEEIAEILGRIDELTAWAKDVQDYALQEALDGEHFDGWKLVEGRAVRKYADDLKVAEALQAAGYPEAAIYERKLLGITAMEKLVGKKKLTEVLGYLIVKPAGKPVLVPESDKRDAINTTESARKDFNDLIKEDE